MPGEDFRQLVEGAADPLLACDAEERICYANPAVHELLGWGAGELAGRSFTALLPPRLHRIGEDSLLAHLLRHRAELAGRPVRAPALRRDGAEVAVELSVGRAQPEGGGWLVVTLRRPVQAVELPGGMTEGPAAQDALSRLASEARRAEQARAEQGALLDTLWESAPIGLCLFDTQLRYVRVNARMADLHRTPREAHVGRTPGELMGAPGVRLERLLRRVLRTGRPVVNFEVSSERFRIQGRWRAWRVSFSPVRLRDGTLLGVGAVVEDITERKRSEEERHRLLHEAQLAVQVRDDFLSIASHELKTPLTPLSLRLANLQRRLERGEGVEPEMVQQARKGLLRLAGLINDLLDSSRIADGRLALHPQPVRMEALVERVARAGVPPRDALHPLEVRVEEGPVLVRGDPDRLAQVVSNLVDNAVKYSPGGGPIAVELTRHGDAALLAVRDRGIGIPEDQQEHLFDRYFRARNVSTHKFGGLGLGLYICRDIVERHGGRIWVESHVGEGSTFFVALPLLHVGDAPTPRHEGASTLH